MDFEPVIGLEAHVELQTQSKMFCGCAVVDSVSAAPNSAVCEICAGMPGTLPVVNQRAVEYALRVALALDCTINHTSIFARKNYFYPDLPKGYQISQYEQPLALNGRIVINTAQGERVIRIRRVHLEEDTGKLTHISTDFLAEARMRTQAAVGAAFRVAQGADKPHPYSLVDLNRAGVPLLEIVTEPDFRSAEEVREYAESLRALVRALGVNSGDLEKGVMRIEPNISVRPVGQTELGTKVEIKNLNSFRALERGVAYEIKRQIELINAGGKVAQETVGWDEAAQATFSQRSKEEAHDYRYFPEPDLPPLVVSDAWIAEIRSALPELPWNKVERFVSQYGLSQADASVLASERALGQYYEEAVAAGAGARVAANWILGELFARLNESGLGIESISISPKDFAGLLMLVTQGEINNNTGKAVLAEMLATGRDALTIVSEQGLKQVSDNVLIERLVTETLNENPHEATSYRAGKTNVANFLFGQVMRKAGGKANPQVVRAELERQLNVKSE